ncbi:ATP-grasp domain-containing protein [Plastoroseomonas arctica]|uniref:ATP-grasp domain-containing protein n=1 Tax=Plastoroseomonas arctica TaxID=1509237 RepID=A0AAF1K4V0_9PROT|nr:ATP-grasp domain-containing protein [Plastoroseomonas arctica]MBR0656169.1 ATP-grasp domain-containing protein [Plastoroseomonas arctica]
MTQTVLLTLGRLPKALDIARSFSALGWRVLVAEPFGMHLAGVSRAVAKSFRVTAPIIDRHRYLADLAAIVTREGVSLVIPISEETMHVAHLPPLLPPSVRVFTMPPETILPIHHKGGFVDAATSFGCAVPETHLLGSDAATALAASFDVVLKPVHSCSGRGVRMLPRGTPLPDAGTEPPSIIQRFIPGALVSSCTLAHEGRVQATALYRATQLSGSVAIAFERVENPAIEAWIARFVAGAGWTGFIAFDIILDRDGAPHGIECNPRTTSGLHFFRTEDIAPAILDPTLAPRLRDTRELQQFFSCLTETQKAMFRPGFGKKLHALLHTPDVTWSARDPWPLLAMPVTTWKIIWLSIRHGATFGEVATVDVGWS